MPDLTAIEIGAFADQDFPPPEYSVYEGRKHHWLVISGDAISHFDWPSHSKRGLEPKPGMPAGALPKPKAGQSALRETLPVRHAPPRRGWCRAE
jgi:hypothetical protein